jgi:DNA-binding SARP family transcriptional activator/Tfp pilus assembly protein PilF
VTLFGRPAIHGAEAFGVFPSKGFQLIALLAAARGKALGRKQVASLLWDSADDALALINLRQLLARIRKLLPSHPHLVIADARSLSLGAGREAVDLWRVLEAPPHDAGDAAELLGLLTGDLLSGVDDGTEAFGDWLAIERSALRERYLSLAATTLLELTRFGRADPAEIAAIGARMLAMEPEREPSHRLLIEAYARIGMYDEAEQIYRTLCAVLASDRGARPSPETEVLMRRIAASRPKASEIAVEGPRRERPRVAFMPPAWPSRAEAEPLLLVFFEDVANELARYRSFTILAPHSSFKIASRPDRSSGQAELRADYSVSGFIKPDASDVVLALRMTDCASQEIVWSAQFGLSTGDLLTSFSLLVRRVASSLAAGFADARLASLRSGGCDESYPHYLDGQRWLANSDLASLRRARRAFQQAADRDPRAADVQARIGQTLYLEWIQLGGSDPHLLIAAHAQARSAIALDPNNAAGHWLDATVALYQRDFDHCQDKFAEAESLCPNSPDILVQYADALAHLGHADLGWRKFERAIDVNPAPPDHYWWAGASISFRRRDYETAIALARRVESEDSVLAILAASHAHLGDLPTARSYGDRLKDIYPGHGVRGKSAVAPDKLQSDRDHRLSGLKLAGVF